ncbi:ABC transporter ATP-binding protein [Cryptosporangium japonicum]|uniref:Nickel import system ATP-binding protein NikD n=1 Tax=Cryptosporangium japonicum TaxID=80872 RepID=A0ABP3D2F9_9ACTN
MSTVLRIRDLTVRFRLRDTIVQAVSGLDLDVRRGELLAIVGESGCGKSVLAHSLMGLLPKNAQVTGSALLRDTDPADTGPVELISAAPRRFARGIRGRRIGLVPQSPATALTPVRTGRKLLEETLRVHRRTTDADTLAADVGLAPADLDRYPFELSGGMAQRLTTALALAPDPPLLIADEPTTGLDRPLVDHTLDLLRRRCDTGGTVVVITHDLTAAERVADRVAVMYASRLVEHRPADAFFASPSHPYAAALLDALPTRSFNPVPGHPPMLTALPDGCAFAPRCPAANSDCARRPDLDPDTTEGVACHHPLVTEEVG